MTKELRNMLDLARKTIEKENSQYTDARPKQVELEKPPTTRYARYRYKLERGNTDNFNCDDILFFFYDLMKENHEGVNYFISNALREKKQIKIAIERYGAPKVLEMTEYLMTSDQTLLKIGTFSPAILSTKWGNTINVLTKEWIDTLNKPLEPTSKSSREWGEVKSDDYHVSIGEWGDE